MKHSIATIHIKNFRSIIDEKFILSDFTALVGYNNGGKSNILTAIKWLLSKFTLSKEDFYDLKKTIEIVGKISGINEILLEKLESKHRVKIEPYIINETILIKRKQTINSKSKDINLLISKDGIDWPPNPAGIDNAIKAIFPEPIEIKAMEDAEEDCSKYKTSTTIGKLISEVTKSIEEKYGTELKRSMNSLKQKLEFNGNQRAPELNELDEKTNTRLEELFPDINIKIHIPAPELKEVFKSGTIKINENSSEIWRDLKALGTGAQRAIQMALVIQLSEQLHDSEEYISTTLLLIDEPDLYLHPQAIEQIRKALKDLSKKRFQVIFSTHSPQMIKSDDIGSTLLIRKDKTKGTYTTKTLYEAIKEIEKDAPHQLQLIFSLSNSNQILFSETVLLTEGKTELRLLPFLFEKINGKTLGIVKYALVPQGGVTNTKKSMEILKVMGLPSKAIVDLDYAFRNAIKDGFIINNEDINLCKMIIKRIAKKEKLILDDNGLPKNKENKIPAIEVYSMLSDDPDAKKPIENIHKKLLENNIWIWKGGSIEKHLGLNGKNENTWAIFKDRVEKNGCEKVINDFLEIKKVVEWILQ